MIPPEYVRVSIVGRRRRCEDGYQVDAVRRWVELILRQYLAPSRRSVPTARAGRWAARSAGAELEAVAVQVDGVRVPARTWCSARSTSLATGDTQVTVVTLRALAGRRPRRDHRRLRRPAAASAQDPTPAAAAEVARPCPAGRVLMGRLMDGDRTISMLADPDQWPRCVHEGTALLPSGGVELDWLDDDESTAAHPGARCHGGPVRAGLRPVVRRVPVAIPPGAGRGAAGRAACRSDLPGRAGSGRGGLAVDRRQRLYVAEAGDRRGGRRRPVGQRRVGRVALGPGRPVDLVADCTPGAGARSSPGHRWSSLDGPARGHARGLGWSGRGATDGPAPGPRRPGAARAVGRPRPRRGRRARTGPSSSRSTMPPTSSSRPAACSSSPAVPVARSAGSRRRRDGWRELEPLGAPAYDGGAITVNPSGRIGFTTAGGYSSARPARAARHVTTGRVLTYRLDSGVYRTRWGRLFVDACIPPGTAVTARFLTTDLDDVTDPVHRSRPPAAPGGSRTPSARHRCPRSSLLDRTTTTCVRCTAGPRDARSRGSRSRPTTTLETYESRCTPLPGRYLWIVLALTGTER